MAVLDWRLSRSNSAITIRPTSSMNFAPSAASRRASIAPTLLESNFRLRHHYDPLWQDGFSMMPAVACPIFPRRRIFDPIFFAPMKILERIEVMLLLLALATTGFAQKKSTQGESVMKKLTPVIIVDQIE